MYRNTYRYYTPSGNRLRCILGVLNPEQYKPQYVCNVYVLLHAVEYNAHYSLLHLSYVFIDAC